MDGRAFKLGTFSKANGKPFAAIVLDDTAIDLAPGKDWTAPLRNGVGRRDLVAARTALRKVMPQRLADEFGILADRHADRHGTR